MKPAEMRSIFSEQEDVDATMKRKDIGIGGAATESVVEEARAKSLAGQAGQCLEQ